MFLFLQNDRDCFLGFLENVNLIECLISSGNKNKKGLEKISNSFIFSITEVQNYTLLIEPYTFYSPALHSLLSYKNFYYD